MENTSFKEGEKRSQIQQTIQPYWYLFLSVSNITLGGGDPFLILVQEKEIENPDSLHGPGPPPPHLSPAHI
jgi:hypothetical protein